MISVDDGDHRRTLIIIVGQSSWKSATGKQTGSLTGKVSFKPLLWQIKG